MFQIIKEYLKIRQFLDLRHRCMPSSIRPARSAMWVKHGRYAIRYEIKEKKIEKNNENLKLPWNLHIKTAIDVSRA